MLEASFDESTVLDDREPHATFSLPGFDGMIFGLFLPKAGLWIQLGFLVTFQMFIQCAYAAFIYQFIIKRRNSPEAYLLGWGLIIPSTVYAAYFFVDLFNVYNKIVKLAASSLSAVVGFRTIEAMYGTPSSPSVETSMLHYMAYYTSLIPFYWDTKTNTRRKVTVSEILQTLSWLGTLFVLLSLYLSFMMHFDFRPFGGDTVQLDKFDFSLAIFTPQHIANGYCHVVLAFLVLSIGFDGSSLTPKLLGFSTLPIFINPMFASRSATEFWTERWNTMIHTAVKYGVFRPSRPFIGSKAALFLTFVVSGLFHDFTWSVTFYKPRTEGCGSDGDAIDMDLKHDCHAPIFGRVTLFFILTGLVMLLERPFGRLPIAQKLAKVLPTSVISTLIVVAHCPIVYLYCGDWIEGGYVQDFAVGLLHIRRVDG